MNNKIRREDALEYHSKGRPGKIEVIPTKPTQTQRDLSMAYSPGVAEPCLEIAADPNTVNKYTIRGNLVGVISNGTAVLGLGNIGPLASKPVMEGKGILFKIFADIDVFDIEVDATDVEHFVSVVKALEPTFGGINLEDIKAPECFEIERRLKEEMNIPVMHDDQHGTAIIVAAALLNALEIVKKKINKINIVVSGAGASAISCMKLLMALGAEHQNFVVTDTHGVIRDDRENLDVMKKEFATSKNLHTLEDAMKNADVFIGLSKGDIVSPEMLLSMGKNPVVFALANPTPEINYELAVATRKDLIMATGRSDNPNQVNNVLGFPYLFRGALDVSATVINEEMKLAAVKALAELTKKPVPDMVAHAYNQPKMAFGKEYIIPKPIDPRLITTVAPAVAKAAIASGVAKKIITDWEAYEEELRGRIGLDPKITRVIVNHAKKDPKRVVFAEGDSEKILKAAQIVRDEGIAIPILLGEKARIEKIIEDFGLDLTDIEVIDPNEEPEKMKEFADKLYERRKRKGLTPAEAYRSMHHRNYFGISMVEAGEADAFISGLTRNYPSTIKPALQLIGAAEGIISVAGMYILITKKGPFFFADATVNLNPKAEELVNIAELTALAVRQLDIEPVIAMLSFSNFGSNPAEGPKEVAKAVEMLKKKHPDMIVDGEIQANFALNNDLLKDHFPFSTLVDKNVNTLIFPDLNSGNIAYKLMQEMGGAEAIGPVLLGIKKSIHVLQLGSSVREIVNMVALAVMDAQLKA